jgi:hypothetical protein
MAEVDKRSCQLGKVLTEAAADQAGQGEDMHAFWIALGIIVLVAGFLDVFLTALNYDEAGFLATRLCTLQWRGLRSITRRLSRRWRPIALRQVTGLQIMLSVMTWLGCVIVGFGFIYYGRMEGTNFQYDGHGLGPGMFSAMYLSAAQLATVGTSQITPETNLLRVLTIAETLGGLVLVTLILTFLLGVYQVVRDLRRLSSNFATVEPHVGDAVVRLHSYFPQGQPVGLDGYLQAISDSFWSYSDGLRLHHITYYFQSGRDQFSLPYALHMMVRTIAALRWGLPSGHAATAQPVLTRLIPQFEAFADYLHDQLGWTSAAVPEVVSFDDFAAARNDEARDVWLGRFLRLNRDMARLARLDDNGDTREIYERYRQWLPFAYRAEQVTAAVSRDLDYQPLIHGGDWPTHDRAATAGPPTARTLARPWRVFLNRWVAVPDPGLSRLASAAGATMSAASSVVTLCLLLSFAGAPVLPAAMFGGMVGMYAAITPNDFTVTGRRLTTMLMVLPAVIAAALGAAVAPSFALGSSVMAFVALLAVWIGGFGDRLAALGQMAFMAYYFTLLLQLPLPQFPAIAVAAAIGTIWAYLFRFLIFADHPNRVLLGGLDSFRARLVLMFDPLIDAVSAARWDPDKQIYADLNQLHQTAAFLQGRLRVIDPSTSLGMQARPGELRLLVFDTELAADSVIVAARNVAGAGTTLPMVLRGKLAGMLDRAQHQLHHRDSHGAAPASALSAPAPSEGSEGVARFSEDWPTNARRLDEAVAELIRAAGSMRRAQIAALADPSVAAGEVTTETDLQAAPPGPISAQAPSSAKSIDAWWSTPTSRRAIQTALATGLALLGGAAVTTSTHQYWAALAAFLVLGGTSTVEETRVKGFERVIGTIAGAVIGFGVIAFIGADPFVVLPLLAVCVFAAMYLQPVSNTQTVFWLTMMLALLYELLGTLTKETLQVRVLETVIGAAIALGVATFVLPIRTRQKVNDAGVVFLKKLDDIIETCLERLAGGSDISSLANQTLSLDQRFRQLIVRAEPLRSGAGSLSTDGIERRLTSAAALTYYARHLIKTTEVVAPGAAPLSAEASTKLGSVIRDNISTLIQVLNNEPTGTTHASEDLPLEPDAAPDQQRDGNAGREAAHYLVRINQTIVTLIEELTPDIADRAAA